MECMDILKHIQQGLEDYRKIVALYKTNEMEDFSVIASKGANICETMLMFIMKQKNIEIYNGRVMLNAKQKIKNRTGADRVTLLTYCAVYDETIVPVECVRLLKTIREHRNHAVHVGPLNREMGIEFSKALDYFVAWFSEEYISEQVIGPEYMTLKRKFFSVESILSSEEFLWDGDTHSGLIKQLLRKIDEQTNIIVNLSKQVSTIDERSERIEKTVNEIDKQLKELTNQICAYQSLVERQLEKADSEIEKDRIIQGYTDECVERIVKTTNTNAERRTLEVERRKLITSIGENAWRKLDESSKTFLISSKMMYNHLLLVDDQIDYSGVCVLVTKALEVEMSKRFYTRFLDYLKNQYGNNYSQYHTALLYEGRRPLRPEKFNMGNIAFAMCYSEDKKTSPERKTLNKRRLLEYSKAKLFPGKTEDEISEILHDYAENIEKIRVQYRNPSAHTDELHQVDAENCFNLVLDVEKMLKKMMDSFAE